MTQTVSTVSLNVIRLLSKGMKDRVDALLGERGLHLPGPGEEGATPLSIRCCDWCHKATAAATKRARSKSSWLEHLDDVQFPQHTMRVNGKKVKAFLAPPGDESFVFEADGSTAVTPLAADANCHCPLLAACPADLMYLALPVVSVSQPLRLSPRCFPRPCRETPSSTRATSRSPPTTPLLGSQTICSRGMTACGFPA